MGFDNVGCKSVARLYTECLQPSSRFGRLKIFVVSQWSVVMQSSHR